MPLLFYLDRTVPVLPDVSAEPTNGYVLVPERRWAELRRRTNVEPLLTVVLERFRLVLTDTAVLRRQGAAAPPPILADDIVRP